MFVSWMDVDTAFAELNAISRRMDALLGRRGLDGHHGLRSEAPTLHAAPELERTADGYRFVLDLPGVAQADVSMQAENGTLTLETKRATTGPEGWQARYAERRAYELRRTFRLPEDVDLEGIAANLVDGVLTVTLPKRLGSGPRTIEVQFNH